MVMRLVRRILTDLGQLLIRLGQLVHGVVEDLLDERFFLFRVEIEFGHLHSVGLAFFPTEAEDDDRLHLLFHDHFDDLVAIRFAFRPAFFPHVAGVALGSVPGRLEHGHGRVEIILLEVGLLIDDHEESVAACDECMRK